MSRNSRRSRRRIASAQRSQQRSWLRRYLRTLSTGIAAASIGTVSMLGQPSQAADRTWFGNTSINWADAANWNVLPISGDSMTFDAPGTAGTILTDNLTTGTGSWPIAGITFTAGASAYTISPAGAGNTYTLTGGISNASASTQTINSAIFLSGTDTITTLAGGGNVTLAGSLGGTGILAA